MHCLAALQATRQAVEVMLAAVTATGEAADKVDATLAELQQLQVCVKRVLASKRPFCLG